MNRKENKPRRGRSQIRGKMLRPRMRSFQGAGRVIRWRFLAVSWKCHDTWQIVDLGYRNESSRAFLKSLKYSLTGIILFLRVKTSRSTGLWQTDHKGGRERKTPRRRREVGSVLFSRVRDGQYKPHFFVVGSLLSVLECTKDLQNIHGKKWDQTQS